MRISTAFHPQSDGQVEKANSIIKRYLQAYYTNDQVNWDQHLPLAEFTYNSTRQKSIGMTPFEADLGYTPRSPLAIATGINEGSSATVFITRMRKILEVLYENLEESQGPQTFKANKHRVGHNFSVGDSVFLNTKNLPIGYANDDPHRRKLQHPYAGPFKLIERIGDNVFRLDISTYWPLHDVFNVDRFKCNDVDNSQLILPLPPLRTTKGGKVEFKVDKIINEKKDEHGMQLYHVLWFGGHHVGTRIAYEARC